MSQSPSQFDVSSLNGAQQCDCRHQSIIPSTDVIQLTLTLKMTIAQVVETSVTVNNNSPIQDYVHPDDQTQPTIEIIIILYSALSLLNQQRFTTVYDKEN